MIEVKPKCPDCKGKGGRQTKPFWITAWIPCEKCKGTGRIGKAPSLEDEARVRLQRAGSVDFASFLLAQSAAIRLAGHKDVTLTNKEISALFDCVPELRDFARNACA